MMWSICFKPELSTCAFCLHVVCLKKAIKSICHQGCLQSQRPGFPIAICKSWKLRHFVCCMRVEQIWIICGFRIKDSVDGDKKKKKEFNWSIRTHTYMNTGNDTPLGTSFSYRALVDPFISNAIWFEDFIFLFHIGFGGGVFLRKHTKHISFKDKFIIHQHWSPRMFVLCITYMNVPFVF